MLMRHDLVEVLKDPLKFAAQRGRHMIDDPLSIPTKTINYAKYDLPASSTPSWRRCTGTTRSSSA